MSPPVLRDRLASYVPFVVVAVAGQLSVAWPPGPTDPAAYLASSLLMALILVLLLVRRGMPPRSFVVGCALYTSSVAFLMLASGGMASGLGALFLMPVVGVALYGRRWESVVSVVFVLLAILAVSLVSAPHLLGTTPRRLFLTGAIAAMLSVAIHVLRGRLVESNARTQRLLRHEEALNAAARQLVQLSEPPQITALGAQLAMGIASPRGSEIVRASYFRIEDGMVVTDSQFDKLGANIEAQWSVQHHPGLRDAVATLRPVSAPIDRAAAAALPAVQAVLDASGVTHGAWVPVCPDGKLHGVLGIATSGSSVPNECIERCVALGHILELALSNWAAHRKLELQATAEERRRIARELHDGLAHELAFIASKTRGGVAGTATPHEARELAGAADRALDEARRAITVLSVTRPQSLDDAISQTVEDLGTRLGLAWDLDLADDIEVPGEVTENLLRIVREAITNAASHGASERIRVSLERAERLRLVIEDDGCGFDPGHERAGGFGLQSMRERAASVGAELSVESAPERGTRVAVAFQ
jgi:signal transduction histidine kinase